MATYTTNFNLKKPDLSDPVDVGDINGNMDLIDTAMKAILDKLYPIGAVYMSADSTNPSVFFGGTWEAISGRFLLGAGGTYTSGSTGGEATHTLSIDELPNITGTIVAGSGSTGGGYGAFRSAEGVFSTQNERARGKPTDATESVWPSGSAYERVNLNVGGGQPVNNMPPYHVVYIWKRVA